MIKKNQVDSLDSLLWLAHNTRKNKTSWHGGFSIDRKIIEFAQRNKAISYREARSILKQTIMQIHAEKEFTKQAEKFLKITKPYFWKIFYTTNHLLKPSELDPIIFPVSYEEGKEKSFKKKLLELMEKKKEVRNKYFLFQEALENNHKAIKPIIAWIELSYSDGTLESKLLTHKKNLNKKKQTQISKGLVRNLIKPEEAMIVKGDGELPSLSMGEREALQFLFWKVDNMKESEIYLKNFLLGGKKENFEKDGLLIVFEAIEVLKSNYGEHMSFSGTHYKNLAKNLHKLFEKKRKLLIKTRKGILELSLTLINKLEMKFTPNETKNGKSYIAVQIPACILKIHDKLYTTYPSDHFAILRNTQPNSVLGKTETNFFDFLYQERPIKKGKSRTVRRIKKTFLVYLGKNTTEVTERLETIYIPKAINMGLLKSFNVETNRQGDVVYVFEYEDQEKLNLLIGMKEGKDE